MQGDMARSAGQDLNISGSCRLHSPSRGQVLIWNYHGEPNERYKKVCLGGVCHNLICHGKYDEADHLLRKFRGDIGPTDADLLLLVADCDLMLRDNQYFCCSADLERIRLLLLLLSLEELTQWGLDMLRNNRNISAIILFHVACNMKLRCEEPQPSDYQQWINYFLSNTYSSAETIVSNYQRSYRFVCTSVLTFMGQMKNLAVKDNITSDEFRTPIEAIFDNYVASLFVLMGYYEQAKIVATRGIAELQMCIIRGNPYSEYNRIKGDLLCNRGQSFFNQRMVEQSRTDFRDALESYTNATNVSNEEIQRSIDSAERMLAMANNTL